MQIDEVQNRYAAKSTILNVNTSMGNVEPGMNY